MTFTPPQAPLALSSMLTGTRRGRASEHKSQTSGHVLQIRWRRVDKVLGKATFPSTGHMPREVKVPADSRTSWSPPPTTRADKGWPHGDRISSLSELPSFPSLVLDVWLALKFVVLSGAYFVSSLKCHPRLSLVLYPPWSWLPPLTRLISIASSLLVSSALPSVCPSLPDWGPFANVTALLRSLQDSSV